MESVAGPVDDVERLLFCLRSSRSPVVERTGVGEAQGMGRNARIYVGAVGGWHRAPILSIRGRAQDPEVGQGGTCADPALGSGEAKTRGWAKQKSPDLMAGVGQSGGFVGLRTLAV